jgi:vacuolar protein sorting-associated protein 35
MEEDQEKYLDDALKIVKSQSFQMHKNIENNQLRFCLKESSIMISELKTSLLTPRNYYQLYTIIFDEMQYLEQYFKEEYRRGRKIKDLYESVQQASSIIPRLYLLITAGSVYIESQEVSSMEVIFDLLGMVKGVQNPLRGLFLRYFLLKMIKDKLPDVGNEYESENSKLADTLKFIMQNLEEMNRLWIRLSTGCTGNEKLMREKERNELKVLVGENIIRLASLNGLSLEIYKEEILNKMINILLDSKDQLSQQYLMECIIHAFPDEYNIHCMDTILDTCTRLVPSVDVKGLFISLMEKLAKFVGDSSKDQTEILESAEKIFDLLKSNISKIINDNISGNMDSLKLIELLVAFMKFTLKCCPNKLETVNHIMQSSEKILSKSKTEKNSQELIKLVGRLLSAPLESTLSIFDLPVFPILMNYLDFSSRSTLALRIIESLVGLNTREKLDTVEKMNILLDFIKPLLVDSNDGSENDLYQFEYEQQSVAKLIFIIKTENPETQRKMLETLRDIFMKGGFKRQKYTLPPLVNAYHIFISNVTQIYAYNLNPYSINDRPNHENYLKNYSLEFSDSSEFISFTQKVYGSIEDIINVIRQEYPENAFRLMLNTASNMRSLKTEGEIFSENCLNLLNDSLSILQDSKLEADRKLGLLNILISTTSTMSTIPKEKIIAFINSLVQFSQTLPKRSEQTLAILNCSHLYMTDFNNDLTKVQDCLTKAKRFADFAMSNPQNLNLFVSILNKYLFFIEKGVDSLKVDNINDIIELIRNHILTIKTESANSAFLSEIERYFDTTIEIIKTRKNSANHKIFEEIIV